MICLRGATGRQLRGADGADLLGVDVELDPLVVVPDLQVVG
jgi:hypothetical protein